MINSRMFSGLFKLNIFLLLLALFLVLNGCSFFKKQEKNVFTPEKLYSLASDEYKENNYNKAREYFTRLKEEYPLHEMAILAEIGIADSFYSDKEYAEAENAYSDFISMHPVNENVPYAIYQMGMCNYHQIEAVDRDQSETIKARKQWEKLISRYPESKFSPLAKTKLKEVKQKLAQREFYVGKFYFKKKKYQAALSRFETIAREYPDSGFDNKVKNYIDDTKAKIAEEEKEKLKKEAKKKQKEQQKLSKEVEKKKEETKQ
ncbi:MAG: outer membrane protein assembly factor BamD [Smithella sp.]